MGALGCPTSTHHPPPSNSGPCPRSVATLPGAKATNKAARARVSGGSGRSSTGGVKEQPAGTQHHLSVVSFRCPDQRGEEEECARKIRWQEDEEQAWSHEVAQ